MCGRAKEIKHSGPNIGKKVVKKASVVKSSVRSSSVKPSTPPPPPARLCGRLPKKSSAEKLTAPTDVVDSAKRRSDGPNSSNSSSALAADKFPLR